MDKPPSKQQLIKRIHAQAREAKMDDETRRLGMKNLVGKTSTADMDIGELHRVSAWLATRGGKVRAPKRPTGRGASGRALSLDAQAQKLRAMWIEMHQLGMVRDPSEAALCSWAANSRSPNVTTLLDLIAGTQEMDKTIERLKQWRARLLRQGKFTCPQCGKSFQPTQRQALAWPYISCDAHEPPVAYQWRREDAGGTG